jgi:hypothetical protein
MTIASLLLITGSSSGWDRGMAAADAEASPQGLRS